MGILSFFLFEAVTVYCIGRLEFLKGFLKHSSTGNIVRISGIEFQSAIVFAF